MAYYKKQTIQLAFWKCKCGALNDTPKYQSAECGWCNELISYVYGIQPRIIALHEGIIPLPFWKRLVNRLL